MKKVKIAEQKCRSRRQIERTVDELFAASLRDDVVVDC